MKFGVHHRFRRFPGYTRDDVDVLEALEPAAAAEFERLLRAQIDSDRRQERLAALLERRLRRPGPHRRPRPPSSE